MNADANIQRYDENLWNNRVIRDQLPENDVGLTYSRAIPYVSFRRILATGWPINESKN